MPTPSPDRWSKSEAQTAIFTAALDTTPERVLIVEDQDEMLAFLRELLTQEGYEVLCAANGVEAISILERENAAVGHRPRAPIGVVITDFRMPGATGLELVEHLRHYDWRPSVILVSAFADQALRVEAHRLGAAAVLAKPFSVRDLLDTLAMVMPRT